MTNAHFRFLNFQHRGVLLIWITVGQGPTALTVGAGGSCLDIFSLVYHFSLLSPFPWETARYRLLSPNQSINQSINRFLNAQASKKRIETIVEGKKLSLGLCDSCLVNLDAVFLPYGILYLLPLFRLQQEKFSKTEYRK